MSIPERPTRGKDALLIGILVLSSTASFGLGVLAGREQGRGAPEDDFWIEQWGGPSQEAEPVPQASGLPGATGAAAVGAASIQAQPPAAASSPAPSPAPVAGAYVASKTGTKYYLPWCGTAGRIKEENKVWFATKAEAEAAGYEPAANCKGL